MHLIFQVVFQNDQDFHHDVIVRFLCRLAAIEGLALARAVVVLDVEGKRLVAVLSDSVESDLFVSDNRFTVLIGRVLDDPILVRFLDDRADDDQSPLGYHFRVVLPVVCISHMCSPPFSSLSFVFSACSIDCSPY